MKGVWEFFPSLWTEEACDEIVRMALELPVERAIIGSDTTGDPDKRPKDHRRSNVRWIHPEHEWMPLFHQVEKWFKISNRGTFGLDIDWVPAIQFTEYHGSEGGKYDWHVDVDWTSQNPTHRKLSMIVQLSHGHEYEGGNIEFKVEADSPDEQLLRSRGSCVIFPSFVNHRVTPTTAGKRYSLVAWIEGPKFR